MPAECLVHIGLNLFPIYEFRLSGLFRLLRHDVVRVFVSFCVLVFVRAILSWCP